MNYVNLGKTGLKVSRICLGCMSYGAPATGKAKPGSHAWALNEKESEPFFRQALDLGINFFDTANVYSGGASEEVLGRFLKANIRREAVVIATKLHGVMRDEPNGHGLSRKAIFYELDQSLRRLQTDYVDLYQTHRWDYETPQDAVAALTLRLTPEEIASLRSRIRRIQCLASVEVEPEDDSPIHVDPLMKAGQEQPGFQDL
jgi:aryl-alcohol dehydrogenase-like predicted oxidoreductase